MSALLQPPPDRDQPGASRLAPPWMLVRASLFSAGTLARGGFALGLILQAGQAPAQEALRSSLAGEAAAEARHITGGMPYTFKNGDFRLLITPSLNLEWNDNVRLSSSNPEDDYILRPAVGFNGSYPLTDRNLFQLNVTAGYNYYFNHHDLSQLYLGSDSGVSFDIFIKDLLINLHDRFSFIQDSATEPAVSGTGGYGTFQNTAGLSGTWDLDAVTLTLGYDHQTSLATDSQFSYTDQNSELLVGRAGFKLHPALTVGVEATGSFTAYEQHALNDSTSWSGGVYGEWHPDAFFSVKPRFGYTVYYGQQTSQSIPASDQNSWYADLTVNHQATKFLTYSVSAGHELRLGIESDTIEDTYVRPNLTWNFIKNVAIGTSLSYEQGTQGGGQLATTFGQKYDYFGAGFSASYSPMKRLNVSLNYNLTLRSADVDSGKYTQNMVGITFAYVLP
jgi:hypothetical protein